MVVSRIRRSFSSKLPNLVHRPPAMHQQEVRGGVAFKCVGGGDKAAVELRAVHDPADVGGRVACFVGAVLQFAPWVPQEPNQNAFMAALPAGIGALRHWFHLAA